MLFPGGPTCFNQSKGYADAGQYIYEIAQDMNNQGDYFPIFGVCLGFEFLYILACGRDKEDSRVNCSSSKSIPLRFAPGKLFLYMV